VTNEPALGWAFLVARGRQTGYQLLLAPDFIMTSRESALLMDEIRGEVPVQGPPVVTDIAAPASGPLCMVYRTVRATRADVGTADLADEPLLDRAGRPLVLTYGFICRGSNVIAPHDQDLGVARDAAVATYRRFHAAEETFAPETSRPYSLQSTVAPAEAALSAPATPRSSAPAEPAHSWYAPSRSPAPWTSQTLPGSESTEIARRRPAIVISLIAVAALALFGLTLRAHVFTHGRQVTVAVHSIFPEWTATGQTIHAKVTTNGIAGQCAVIWGPAKGHYTNTSPPRHLTADTKPQLVSIPVQGLTSGEHFRIRVETKTGMRARSSDQVVP
jgi:hypothetical protein